MAVPSIDYDAIRVALVAAVQAATGLGQNAVVMMEPEEPVGNRPDVPFAAIKFTTTSIKTGWDYCQHAGLTGDQAGMFTYSGQRSFICAFDFFGATHEEAYGLAAAWQSGLDQDQIWGALDVAGLAVWRADQVVDLSAMLNTGYEGRAHVTVQFGLTAVSTVDVGYIEHVPVNGQATGDNGAPLTIAFTADLSGD